jgi:hypothetical protein
MHFISFKKKDIFSVTGYFLVCYVFAAITMLYLLE